MAFGLILDDKAPGPSGFSEPFFNNVVWRIIKNEVMTIIHHFPNLHSLSLRWLKVDIIVPILKKDGADEITCYRHISLIHEHAKLIANMLSMRLSPLVDSTFIKKHTIHDNFHVCPKPRCKSSPLEHAFPSPQD
jgi:hypothetical protein